MALARPGVIAITDVYNDNNPLPTPMEEQNGEPHGRVAMLLAESLIHGLIARSVLSIADAIEIVGIAAEVVEALRSGRSGIAFNPEYRDAGLAPHWPEAVWAIGSTYRRGTTDTAIAQDAPPAEDSALPGGVEDIIVTARRHGAQGIAAIRGLWPA